MRAQKTSPEYVDVHDLHRQREIREAEFQQQADAEAKILRTTTAARRAEKRQVPAVTVWQKLTGWLGQ